MFWNFEKNSILCFFDDLFQFLELTLVSELDTPYLPQLMLNSIEQSNCKTNNSFFTSSDPFEK